MRAPLRCRRGRFAILLCAVLASAVPVSQLPALGTEEFGNKPLGPQPGWAAGLIDAINDTHRVYTSWVNGNENFYFSGDSSALEAAMEAFAKVKVDAPEVILLPVPGETKSFEGKPVTFNWRLHAPSGIYLAHVLREKDSNVQFRKPTLFVHIAGGISIEKLKEFVLHLEFCVLQSTTMVRVEVQKRHFKAMKPSEKRQIKRGRPKGVTAKSASFRLPEDLLEKLAEAADTQDRSQTTLVRRALEAYLEKEKD